VVENLGATLDQFDVIDFTDNEIQKVGGFPRLLRLKTLLMSSNRVVRIATGLEESIAGLEEINLTNNKLTELAHLKPLVTLPNLTRLSFIQNPVARLKHYRSFVIYTLPNIKILDFHKVKDAERVAAGELFAGDEGAALYATLSKSTAVAAVGSSVGAAKAKAVLTKSAEEMQRIKEAIKNATSDAELQAAEQMLKDAVAMEE
jgi:U2 small nuclear ribonucleoprotein A'